MQATPTLWQAVLDEDPTALKGARVLVGGEALPSSLAERILAAPGEAAKDCTADPEATVWATTAELAAGGQGPVASIGLALVEHPGVRPRRQDAAGARGCRGRAVSGR
ncbi:hypothetical protein SBADM41S_07434 [Streptomyces badius]